MMKIVCANTVLLGYQAFSSAGETEIIPDQEIDRTRLLDTDALIIRSTTRIDRDLLKGTPVKFVGTATTGTDHIDTHSLENSDIFCCASPGSNANSVSEYLVCALLSLSQQHGFYLKDKTVGVIGCGHVGSCVIRKCRALEMNVLWNDPPLAVRYPDRDFKPLDTVLTESDVVTLHVPLLKQKLWPTERMADYRFFERVKPGAIFINTARGRVCDYDALLDARNTGIVSQCVIDVWDPEPAFRTDIIRTADLASPHIAGHSYEGKLNGTAACYNAFCNFFELEKKWDVSAAIPCPEIREIETDCANREDEEVLYDIVRKIYDIEYDDRQLREAAVFCEAERIRHFNCLRKDYRIRREFSSAIVKPRNASGNLINKLKALGFTIHGE